MPRRAGQLLWNRKRFSLGVGLDTIITGLKQQDRNWGANSVDEPPYGPKPVLVDSRIQVIPLAPISKWVGITHGEPYLDPIDGEVKVDFVNGMAIPLGAAERFGILANTIVNAGAAHTTISGTLANGGYTVAPATGITYVGGGGNVTPGAPYTAAGVSQAAALAYLLTLPNTFDFAAGNIDLATDATHGTVGVFTPGVYNVTGNMSIGAAGIVLNGPGTYVFKSSGTFTIAASAAITPANGATVNNTWFLPVGATTVGADAVVTGNIIDNAGITIGNHATINGRLLAFGGTVTTTHSDTQETTITVPTAALTVEYLNCLFWDPHTKIGPGEADLYTGPTPTP